MNERPQTTPPQGPSSERHRDTADQPDGDVAPSTPQHAPAADSTGSESAAVERDASAGPPLSSPNSDPELDGGLDSFLTRVPEGRGIDHQDGQPTENDAGVLVEPPGSIEDSRCVAQDLPLLTDPTLHRTEPRPTGSLSREGEGHNLVRGRVGEDSLNHGPTPGWESTLNADDAPDDLLTGPATQPQFVPGTELDSTLDSKLGLTPAPGLDSGRGSSADPTSGQLSDSQPPAPAPRASAALAVAPASDSRAGDATVHLNAAISELEDVLSEHHGVESTSDRDQDDMFTGSANSDFRPNAGYVNPRNSADRAPLVPENTEFELGGTKHGEQYSIPLLDEVVLPGGGELLPVSPGPDVEPLVDHRAEFQALADIAGAYRPVFDRLASEIEVIVQSGVDEALSEASKNIRRRVNEHIEIVLPEILDELARKYDGHGG